MNKEATQDRMSEENAESTMARLFCRDANGRPWSSDRLRRVFEEVTERWLGCAVNIRAYRNIVIVISRRFMRDKVTFREDENGEDEDGEDDNIEDLQAGHSSHLVGLIYARGLGERDGIIASRREQFRTSSIN